jgi:hypothetical protein
MYFLLFFAAFHDVSVYHFLLFFAAFHDVSVYPKKELPFFILFTAGLCSFTALLALLTHQYPEPMGIIAKTVSITVVLYHSPVPRAHGNHR